MSTCQNCNAEYPEDELLCEECEGQQEAEMIAREDEQFLHDDILSGLTH